MGGAPGRRNDPKAVCPGRVMTHMLRMSTGEIGHPVVLLVLMKTDDRTLHILTSFRVNPLLLPGLYVAEWLFEKNQFSGEVECHFDLLFDAQSG
jgi:hypothetical protein